MQRCRRLKGNKEFQHVRNHGRSWSHHLLVLCAHPNELAYSRFGFVVGKHVGKAVVRNRVKRRLREAVHARLAFVAEGWDVVLIARSPIVSARFVEIMEALDSLLSRAGLRASAAASAGVTE